MRFMIYKYKTGWVSAGTDHHVINDGLKFDVPNGCYAGKVNGYTHYTDQILIQRSDANWQWYER